MTPGQRTARPPARFPVAKVFLEPGKAVFYLYFYLRFHALGLRRGRRFMHFTGTLPTRAYSIWKVCRLLGLTPSPSRGEPAFQHIDETWCAPAPVAAINGRCCDISKSTVARAFERVFGYPLLIADPTTHAGPIAAKSERNGPRDGVVLHGPLAEVQEGVCYQRLIDTRIGTGELADLRTMVVGDEIVQVVRKTHADGPGHTFGPGWVEKRSQPFEPEDVFSAEERRLIIDFCRGIALDFGELDILRDRADGRIYIVDAATTPHTPGASLTLRQKIAVMHRIAGSFERQFCPRAAAAAHAATAGWRRKGSAAR